MPPLVQKKKAAKPAGKNILWEGVDTQSLPVQVKIVVSTEKKTSRVKKWVTIWHKRKDEQSKQIVQIVLDTLSESDAEKAIAFVTELGKQFAQSGMSKESLQSKKKEFLDTIKSATQGSKRARQLSKKPASKKRGGQ